MEDRLVAQYLPDSAPLRGVLQLVSPSAAIAGLAGFAGSAAHGATLNLPTIGAEYDVGAGPSRRAAAEATGQQLPPPRRSARPDEDYEVRCVQNRIICLVWEHALMTDSYVTHA